MGKEYQWFKFNVLKWLSGEIVYEQYDVQGLFINICALYWKKNGKLKISEIDEIFKKRKLLAKLYGRFISECDGYAVIDFLDEQLSDKQDLSEKNSNNAKKGWEDRKKTDNANLLPNASETDAKSCNIEEDKEENKSKNKNKEDSQARFDFKKNLIEYGFAKNLVEDWLKVRKTKKATNSETAFRAFITEIEKRNTHSLDHILEIIVSKSWSGFKWEWIDEKKLNHGGSEKNISTIKQAVNEHGYEKF